MKLVTVFGAEILTTFDDIFYVFLQEKDGSLYKFLTSRKFSPFWTVFIEILGNFQGNKLAKHQYNTIDTISPFNGLKFGCHAFPLS
ncbi:hypothetical protein M9H77_31509 [Catharanthus roseus]|uniref:Uncharacterized protein n=1 Tax=Catharanthus roseus TaxID=4058 RepID=A0ACC0A1J7_CATRO|nr:hypothetical protein M9H77_31509 [Catharanthus roseus]